MTGERRSEPFGLGAALSETTWPNRLSDLAQGRLSNVALTFRFSAGYVRQPLNCQFINVHLSHFFLLTRLHFLSDKVRNCLIIGPIESWLETRPCRGTNSKLRYKAMIRMIALAGEICCGKSRSRLLYRPTSESAPLPLPVTQ